MVARVCVLGGGSYHWTPRIISDIANTPGLHEIELVLHDLDGAKAAAMVEYGEHVASARHINLHVSAMDDRRSALRGSDFVVSAISVGAMASMRHDLEIPELFGIRQPIGDSIGPGGVMRALRSVPVVESFARDAMEECPNALFINVSNPLSVLTQAVASTGLRTVGLCNELIGCAFLLSLITDAPMHEIDPVVGGINHFPMITSLRFGNEDGFERLRDILADLDGPTGSEPVWMTPPSAMHWQKFSEGERWTKADVVRNCPVKLEIFDRFGVLPGAHDHHIAEFMPGFVHPDAGNGAPWRISHYGVEGHQRDADADVDDFRARRDAADVTRMPSGELVASLLDSAIHDRHHAIPVNILNAGQVTNLPEGSIVECMGRVDAGEIVARDVTTIPSIMGEYARRTVEAQRITLQAARSGDRELALQAMLADPLAGRLPFERVVSMTDKMIDALVPWLPQFANSAPLVQQ